MQDLGPSVVILAVDPTVLDSEVCLNYLLLCWV